MGVTTSLRRAEIGRKVEVRLHEHGLDDDIREIFLNADASRQKILDRLLVVIDRA